MRLCGVPIKLPFSNSWASGRADDGTSIVWPVFDLRQHEFKDGSCWCDPFVREDLQTVHRALDRRDQYEEGELSPD